MTLSLNIQEIRRRVPSKAKSKGSVSALILFYDRV